MDGSGELTDDLLKGNADDTGLEGVCKQYLEGLKVKNIAQHGRYWSEKRVFTVYTQRENISPEHFVEGLKL